MGMPERTSTTWGPKYEQLPWWVDRDWAASQGHEVEPYPEEMGGSPRPEDFTRDGRPKKFRKKKNKVAPVIDAEVVPEAIRSFDMIRPIARLPAPGGWAGSLPKWQQPGSLRPFRPFA